MGFAIFLDIFVSVLLAVTIGYAVILNARLKRFRTGEKDMRAAIERFNASTAQAEANLAKYKEIATTSGPADRRDGIEAGRALAPLVKEARELAADLNLLISRGESVIEDRPAAQPKQVASGRRVDRANPSATWSLDDEELELIDALRDAR